LPGEEGAIQEVALPVAASPVILDAKEALINGHFE
jgi:hypothetical protein